MTSIEADQLTKCYRKGVTVLDHVTFRYRGAGAIGYLGPNGSGKSTTMKLLVGLIAPTEGVALVNDIDPMKDRQGALWDVGAVIENPEPYRSETVFDALNRVGVLRGLDAEGINHDIDRCNEELDLPPLGQRCGTLSKGQRQRVALAAARMGDPRILLLDEPTDGMDPAVRAHVRARLRELRKDHLILLSSHLMGDVMEVCDRLIFIDKGRVLLQDSTEAIAGRTQSKVVEVEFAEAIERSAWENLGVGVEEVRRIGQRRYRIHFDGKPETRDQVLRACLRVGKVRSYTSAYPALEDAYLQVIGATSTG